jgi:sec-independent protein translocase protein TatB
MFDIGFSELFIVAVIALLVLGPERLPGAVRKIGLIVGKVRAGWNGIQDELNKELEADELKKQIQSGPASFQQTLNNNFDIDAYNAKILEQERKIREDLERSAQDQAIEQDQTTQQEQSHTSETKISSSDSVTSTQDPNKS